MFSYNCTHSFSFRSILVPFLSQKPPRNKIHFQINFLCSRARTTSTTQVSSRQEAAGDFSAVVICPPIYFSMPSIQIAKVCNNFCLSGKTITTRAQKVFLLEYFFDCVVARCREWPQASYAIISFYVCIYL